METLLQNMLQWVFHGPLAGVLVWVGAVFASAGVAALVAVAILMIGRGMVVALRGFR